MRLLSCRGFDSMSDAYLMTPRSGSFGGLGILTPGARSICGMDISIIDSVRLTCHEQQLYLDDGCDNIAGQEICEPQGIPHARGLRLSASASVQT